MNAKEAIGLITLGIGIGGAIATAVVSKLGGVEIGMTLKIWK